MIGATGPLNFTLFLTLMGERVQNAAISTDAQLIEAFEQFDEHRTGKLTAGQLQEILASGNGEHKLSSEEVLKWISHCSAKLWCRWS